MAVDRNRDRVRVRVQHRGGAGQELIGRALDDVTAASNTSRGSSPSSTTSGWRETAGTNGRNPMIRPVTTSTTGVGTPARRSTATANRVNAATLRTTSSWPELTIRYLPLGARPANSCGPLPQRQHRCPPASQNQAVSHAPAVPATRAGRAVSAATDRPANESALNWSCRSPRVSRACLRSPQNQASTVEVTRCLSPRPSDRRPALVVARPVSSIRPGRASSTTAMTRATTPRAGSRTSRSRRQGRGPGACPLRCAAGPPPSAQPARSSLFAHQAQACCERHVRVPDAPAERLPVDLRIRPSKYRLEQ